jgi:ABC-2 type transport system permease protein
VFVGGVFTSTQFLPPLARTISMFNPMFYMINAFRYSYTHRGDAPLAESLGIVALLAATAFGVALRMTAAGYKLRT